MIREGRDRWLIYRKHSLVCYRKKVVQVWQKREGRSLASGILDILRSTLNKDATYRRSTQLYGDEINIKEPLPHSESYSNCVSSIANLLRKKEEEKDQKVLDHLNNELENLTPD